MIPKEILKSSAENSRDSSFEVQNDSSAKESVKLQDNFKILINNKASSQGNHVKKVKSQNSTKKRTKSDSEYAKNKTSANNSKIVKDKWI